MTTAARYADAVPWELLHAAGERSTALAVVLDRVPPDAVEEVSGHLRSMLAEHGLSRPRLLVVPETELEDGLLPAAASLPYAAGWTSSRPTPRRAQRWFAAPSRGRSTASAAG